MDTERARELPARLEEVRQRFQRWRETCEAHARIPDSLWASAALVAGRHGLSKTASVLRVNYYALKKRLAAKTAADRRARKKRIERGAAAAGDGPETEGTAAFVELPPFASAATNLRSVPGQCFMELEDGSGAKMRIRLQGVGMPDLAALGRSFWDRRP
jgi:hypothetical protein